MAGTEWAKLETLLSLLKPFQEHTDLLQADGNTLSNLIPAVLDVECFLDDCKLPGCITIAKLMKSSLMTHTAYFMEPEYDNFEPLPAVASYLDPAAFAILGTRTVSWKQQETTYLRLARNASIRITMPTTKWQVAVSPHLLLMDQYSHPL